MKKKKQKKDNIHLYNSILCKYHNRFLGQPGIVYCCGESLNWFDFDHLNIKQKENCIHIAMKLAILSKNIPRIDYYFFGDQNDKSHMYEKQIKYLKCKKFGLVKHCLKDHRFCYSEDFCKKVDAAPLDVCYDHGFQPDISKYGMFKAMTFFPVMQFALYCGLNPIYIVGFDCSDKQSFLPDEFQPRKVPIMEKVIKHKAEFSSFLQTHYPTVRLLHVNPVVEVDFLNERIST